MTFWSGGDKWKVKWDHSVWVVNTNIWSCVVHLLQRQEHVNPFKSVISERFTSFLFEQVSNLVKSLDNSLKNPTLVDVVNRSVARGLTRWLTLTVREGMLRTHPPKWSPHVGNVKYSPALISLAPAVFLFTKPPSPNSSSPGVCDVSDEFDNYQPPPPPSPSTSPSLLSFLHMIWPTTFKD